MSSSEHPRAGGAGKKRPEALSPPGPGSPVAVLRSPGSMPQRAPDYVGPSLDYFQRSGLTSFQRLAGAQSVVHSCSPGDPSIEVLPPSLPPAAHTAVRPAGGGGPEGGKTPFYRVHVTGKAASADAEAARVCGILHEVLDLRQKYVPPPPPHAPSDFEARSSEPGYEFPRAADAPAATAHSFEMGADGVVVARCDETGERFAAVPREEYLDDLTRVMNCVSDGPCKTFAYNRLKIQEARFRLHRLLNEQAELSMQRQVPHRDFYNTRKIDNHVHHSACMNQKHLLRFIKSKLKNCPDDVVLREKESGRGVTLREVFERLKLTAYDLSVDALDMSASVNTFQRFDKFNKKYNPLGQSELREVFLKVSNLMEGRYLAEITRQVFDDLEANKYQYAEYRLSIYGRRRDEWGKLGRWVVRNGLFSRNVRWMIQIPRLYHVYRASGLVANFQEMIDNIFLPLFRVTVDPRSDPDLHAFLLSVVAFDSVDDESIREPPYTEVVPSPAEWDRDTNPPYSLWAYYLYANLSVLNQLRRAKGLNTFAYRPHAGEAGDVEHLAATYLTANSINHGLVLWHSPVLQYLYYLTQIGISMSPLSNNILFVEYDKNPFPRYFARGLNVTLSTDDPLMIHVTKEPLVEEYSVAAQVWKLTSVDLSEIARNSVLQSGFEPRFKAYWIGNRYHAADADANDIHKTNMPDIRLEFRHELLEEELDFIDGHLPSGRSVRPSPTPSPRGSVAEAAAAAAAAKQ